MDEQQKQALWQIAKQARTLAYAPYSNYFVGAALLGKSGKIYTGCNIENAAYGPSNCAERTAIFKAVSEGERQFSAIAVVTANSGTPCGVCRQVLREFAKEIHIIVGDETSILREYTLDDLLPNSFGPEFL